MNSLNKLQDSRKIFKNKNVTTSSLYNESKKELEIKRLMRELVIDASVVLKWHFPDEEGNAQAFLIFELFTQNNLKHSAPDLLDYEVFNAFPVASRKKWIGKNDLQRLLDHYTGIEIEKMNINNFIELALQITVDCSRNFYDSSYLSLAQMKKIPLITDDKKLFNAVQKNFEYISWIDDFQ